MTAAIIALTFNGAKIKIKSMCDPKINIEPSQNEIAQTKYEIL